MNLSKKIILSLFSLIIWLGIGTFAFNHLEGWNYIQSFYFSVVTLATVGYGDLTPTNDLSRFFVSFYILLGTGIVISSIGIISGAIVSKKEQKLLERYRDIKKIFNSKK